MKVYNLIFKIIGLYGNYMILYVITKKKKKTNQATLNVFLCNYNISTVLHRDQGALTDSVIKRGTHPLDYNIMISYKDAVNVGIYRIMNVSI